MLQQATDLWPLVFRDFVVVVGARHDVDWPMLDGFARRRASAYSNPVAVELNESYWTGVATALATIGAPDWMPMTALISNGVTLEGGARGLRGLLFRDPSDKERRRVIKVATLAARVMDIVATANRSLKDAERRWTAISMASFGLAADEIEKTRSTAPVTFESLEIFGELDARTRRDLLHGAWQLGLLETVDPAKDMVLRGIAARLEVSAEFDGARSEVAAQIARQTDLATLAIELLREPARVVDTAKLRPWIEHLVQAVAPPGCRAALLERAFAVDDATHAAPTPLDGADSRRAISLALASLLALDVPVSAAAYLRSALQTAAMRAGIETDAEQAFELIDRYVFLRVRDHATAVAASPVPLPIAITPPTAP